MNANADHALRLQQARRRAIVAAAVLAVCVAAASLRSAPWPANLGWTMALLVPVGAPLPGLLRGARRTYAWATLCVAPYFIYGIMEVVANPAVRGAASAILFASFAWFVTLVWYLRLSRGQAPDAHGAAGA